MTVRLLLTYRKRFASILRKPQYVSQEIYNTTKRPLASQANQNDENNQKRKQFTTEFKILAPSLALGLVSWLASNYFDRQHAKKQVQLELITEQIRKLYGPLYGNRLVHHHTYKAVVGDHNDLTTYLAKAKETKNSNMVRKWRAFAFDVLYPLDKEAADLICKNGHLLTGMHFSDEFEKFLAHFARFQFVIEDWKDKNGKLDLTKNFTDQDYSESSNAAGDKIHFCLLKHIEEEYKGLREKQKRIAVDVISDDTDKLAENLVSKVASLAK